MIDRRQSEVGQQRENTTMMVEVDSTRAETENMRKMDHATKHDLKKKQKKTWVGRLGEGRGGLGVGGVGGGGG